MDQLRREFAKIPDLLAVPQDLASHDFIAGRGFPIELNLRGPDYHVLEQKSQEIIQRMQQTGDFRDIDTDFRTGMPEVRIYPDRAEATASGVSVDTIASTVQAAIGGAVQGQYTNKDRRYDVRLRLEGGERIGPDDIMKLDVRTDYDELIPISSVIKTQTVSTYQTIARRLRERSISIFANVAPGKSRAESLDQAESIAKAALPLGYRVFLSGGAQTFRETFSSLFLALWLGIIVSYMVLASQFNSFVHAVLRAVVAAVLRQRRFLRAAAHRAVAESLQHDRARSAHGHREEKFHSAGGIREPETIRRWASSARSPALRRPGPAAADSHDPRWPPWPRRFLPALAWGPGAESRIPMAITVIGGVIVSTFFTLLVVPCAYSLLARFESRTHPERELYGKVSLSPKRIELTESGDPVLQGSTKDF